MNATTTLAALLAMQSLFTIAAEVSATFLDQLAQVESGRDDTAYNQAEDAHGRYQIRAGYLADANEVLGTSYSLADCHNPEISERVVRAYLMRYGSAYEQRTGNKATPEILARIHNGGPRGYERDCTLAYAEKFKEVAR